MRFTILLLSSKTRIDEYFYFFFFIVIFSRNYWFWLINIGKIIYFSLNKIVNLGRKNKNKKKKTRLLLRELFYIYNKVKKNIYMYVYILQIIYKSY